MDTSVLLGVAFLLVQCSGLTYKIEIEDKNIGYLTEVVFDVTARQKLQCFNELFTANQQMNFHLRAVNIEGQKVKMRISSSSGQFSEWFEGINNAMFSGMAQESGSYEVCATSYVPTGQYMRLSLVIHTVFVKEQLKSNASEGTDGQMEIKNSINRLANSIMTSSVTLKQLNLQTSRDMYLQTQNARYIDAFSLLQTIIIICTAVIQVFVLRRFFTINANKIRI